jgi:hypothetical protein
MPTLQEEDRLLYWCHDIRADAPLQHGDSAEVPLSVDANRRQRVEHCVGDLLAYTELVWLYG